ncbi:hypothetical protein [Nocardioides sp.]|jgi:hypothetical protein|uniref:hypothetical protein n=1 Tax=Nocardioides sp. TaxID=35761 RepID=UPI00262A9CF4|nr:hypothetical protein [Nocardioides sp.]
MSGPKRDIDKWRNAVLKHPHISDGCRVLLLVLADNMTTDLKVSVSHDQLARKLNRSERRIGGRFREAVGEKPEPDPEKARRNYETRLLDRISRGQKNARSVYQGLMPDPVSRTHGCPDDNEFQPDGLQPVENDQKCPVEKFGNRVAAPSLDSQSDTRVSDLLGNPPSGGPNRRENRRAS